MTTLVLGASGATGKLLVTQLLEKGQQVKVMVRATSHIPESWNHDANITIIKEDITTMSINDLARHVEGCQAVASCLGHNLTWKGIFGKPKRLVTDAVRALCEAISSNAPAEPVKFVLMNTAGNGNRDVHEPISFGQKIVIRLLRLLLPPHSDNEQAADYLRVHIGQQHPYIEWTVVRPDTLINESEVTAYSLHVSPTRSAIFNPGKTNRINVGHFMMRLIIDNDTWRTWKGQMPVIYNAAAVS